ncbi:uncharacterized protein LOC131022967 [Salvia miltiorrhiza]|uniref:uncharacterized protein LOC131022967 n=1 Tax=Salvia miltiorrhiza TaxID=226208 RepID=UPI0025AD6308|nr:uncharacterized protein LOC131022967 [Salvia miltiorrhiza]
MREHGRYKDDKRAKTSKVHTTTSRSPFSANILVDTLPRSYKRISLDYDGIKCRIFSTTLTGPAQLWFGTLAPNSIHSFEDLQTRFLRQFASSRRVGKSALSLMDIKQDQNETLREYTARSNLTALEVPEAKSHIKNCTYVRGLKLGLFFDELQIRPAWDFDDIMARLPGYLQLEDARMARKAENDKHKAKRAEATPEQSNRNQDQAAPFRGLPSRALPPQTEVPPRQQPTVNEVNRFDEYTPLNIPQEEIFHIIKNQPFFKAPGTYRDGQPQPGPNNKLCKYHNSYGHYTKQCGHLKHQLEFLVRQGNLDQFIARGNEGQGQRQDQGNDQRQAQGNDRNRCPEENRDQHKGAVQGRALPPPQKGNTYDFRREWDTNFQSGQETSRAGGKVGVLPQADSGSAVNILYLECLQNMGIEANIEPMNALLFGFGGEIVMPMGFVELPVTLGRTDACKTRMIRFLVVDMPKPSYNVILGRPALTAFRAVISMFHLKMKFPIAGGRVGEVWGDKKMSKECHVRILTHSSGQKRERIAEGPDTRKKGKVGDVAALAEEWQELTELLNDRDNTEKSALVSISGFQTP